MSPEIRPKLFGTFEKQAPGEVTNDTGKHTPITTISSFSKVLE